MYIDYLYKNVNYITGGNTNDDFSISASDGNVTLSNALNATQNIGYNLTVSANDTEFVSSVTVPINVKTGKNHKNLSQ